MGLPSHAWRKCKSIFRTPSGRCPGGVFRRYRIRELPQPSKLMMRVRVSLPAPISKKISLSGGQTREAFFVSERLFSDMKILTYLLRTKMNFRVFLVWLYVASAACLSLGILFQLYRAAKALADMAPVLATAALK